MTDSEAYESYTARQDEESYRRQLFLLGAAFGNHQIASKLSKGALSDCVLSDALEALQGSRMAPDLDYACVARELGLQDYERSAKPLELLKLVAKHCRADAAIQATLRGAVKEFMRLEWVRHKGVVEKQDALSRGRNLLSGMQRAFEGLMNEANEPPPPHAAGTWHEASAVEAVGPQ